MKKKKRKLVFHTDCSIYKIGILCNEPAFHNFVQSISEKYFEIIYTVKNNKMKIYAILSKY